MSKKPRPKKRYRPRAVFVPPYLGTLNAGLGRPIEELREEDRTFLLRVSNRTVDEEELVLYCRLFQMAWLLASKMEQAKALRTCMNAGLLSIGAYLGADDKFDTEQFEALASAVETSRDIVENAGQIERAQALKAVINNRVAIGLDDTPINDDEIFIRPHNA